MKRTLPGVTLLAALSSATGAQAHAEHARDQLCLPSRVPAAWPFTYPSAQRVMLRHLQT